MIKKTKPKSPAQHQTADRTGTGQSPHSTGTSLGHKKTCRGWGGWGGGSRTCKSSDMGQHRRLSIFCSLVSHSYPTFTHTSAKMCWQLLMCFCPRCFLHRPCGPFHLNHESLAIFPQGAWAIASHTHPNGTGRDLWVLAHSGHWLKVSVSHAAVSVTCGLLWPLEVCGALSELSRIHIFTHYIVHRYFKIYNI